MPAWILATLLTPALLTPHPQDPAPPNPHLLPAVSNLYLRANAASRRAPRWTWPLSNPRLVRRFDPPSYRWLPGHRGVDLKANHGQAVMAAGAGVVTFAGKVGGLTAIAITHANGLRTTYLPVDPTVHTGQPVSPGTPIGRITGHPIPHCPATCLHWGLIRADRYLDPLLLLGHGEVRLFPLHLTRRQVLP
ncbi:hypothetical protein Aple_047460 [Acrocarpospora pleiomorpha]|uniref:M23ase beta-sheet core domain-containing protein n=1 Tax=Acrocarpospora pleiomorpha TaxID=90975 RepID=A0A5M3XP07_9ACTN|nr:hypothetical protein Aple_047460 [Acrocarpospora pleiomorpha]